MKDICCVGHITHDRVVTPDFEAEMPGGTSWYFAKALSRLAPGSLRVVTAVGDDGKPAVEELREEGIEVRMIPSERSVFFENRYGENMDNRRQRVLAKATPFKAEDLRQEEAAYYHLGTLLADDFDMDTIRMLAQKGKVALDVQGYLRRVEGEEVVHVDFAEKEAILPLIEILKANEVEMEVLTGTSDPREAARRLAGMGCREVVLTMGSKGSLIYTEGKYYEIPPNRPERVVDATGCGDTYMAGYLWRRSLGEDPEAAGRYATAMCCLKLAEKGPLTATDAEIRAVMEKVDSK